MSSVPPAGRSFLPITDKDLKRLAELATEQRTEFFHRRSDWRRLYSRRVLCTALCQGAALHYAGGNAGINDFDVYTFYASHPERPWYAKARSIRDFGDPKFGRSIDRPDFVGRRVDLMGRGIPAKPHENPTTALQRYLHSDRPGTVRFLAKKAVVLIDPKPLRGRVIWLAGAAVQ
jgi:hypothetical protein